MAGHREQRPDSFPDNRSGWRDIALSLLVVVLLAIAVLVINPLREAAGYALHGDTTALREQLEGLGAGGVLILGGLMLVHTFIWYPAEIVDAAAGFVYGFSLALPLVLLGWVIQGLIAYAIGRNAARPLLTRFIGVERFERLERAIANGSWPLLLGARMVPIVPFSLFSYVAGATRVPVRRYIWTTALGYLPITAIFVYLGSRLDAISANDPTIWGVAIVIVGMLYLTHRLRHRFDPETLDPAKVAVPKRSKVS